MICKYVLNSQSKAPLTKFVFISLFNAVVTLINAMVLSIITHSDMLHVMQTAKTPEKCALKLLDYLFDRETQASSNLSGTGKHGKKQLNPLMIYGLRCK